MNWGNAVWWLCFFLLSIVVQIYLPGMDALVIGLIIVLQERRYKYLLWLLPLLIFLQEGIGSREFGGAIIWYMLTIIFFNIGRWLFEVENILFISMLSICLGASHFAIVYFMAPLQNITINIEALLNTSLIQALYVSIIWWLAYFTRKGIYTGEENA